MNPALQKPKKSDANHIRAMVRQISIEPLEIAREATSQVIGIDPTPQNLKQDQPKEPEKVLTPEQIKSKHARDAKHIQEFRKELATIQKLQEERNEERERERLREEQEKKQQLQNQAQQKQFVAPQGRKQRGAQGGGMKKKIHDSERKVEMPKTPTN